MRPTDENQNGSTRPNLMSSGRRGGSETNILAMLERNAERGRLATTPRLALYASAGMVVLVLIAALAWLLYENNSANEVLRMPDPPVAAAPAGPAVADAVSPPAAAPATAPGQSATIVDSPEAPAHSEPRGAAANVTTPPQPALVLLSPDEAASIRKPPPARELTARPPVREAAPAHTAAAPNSPRPAPTAKTAPHPHPPALASTASKPATHPVAPAAKRKSQPSATSPSPEGATTVDSDVALISAIISHGSANPGRAGHGEATGCAGNDKKCVQKPAPEL